jgi:alanine-synthesizing transaminase
MAEGHACMLPMPDAATFLNRLEDLYRTSSRKPKMVLISFPHNPTTTCVEIDFFRRSFAWRAITAPWWSTILRTATWVSTATRRRAFCRWKRERSGGRDFLDVEELQHGRWRVGYCLGNRKMIGALARIKSYLDYGVFQPIQNRLHHRAAGGARKTRRRSAPCIRKRRDVLVHGLKRAGWPVEKPRGSMFVWARAAEKYRSIGSLEFAKLLMEKALVAVSPGIGFRPPGRRPRAFRSGGKRATHPAGDAGDRGSL